MKLRNNGIKSRIYNETGHRKLDHRTSDKPLPLPWQNDRQHTLQTSPWNFRSEGGRDHLWGRDRDNYPTSQTRKLILKKYSLNVSRQWSNTLTLSVNSKALAFHFMPVAWVQKFEKIFTRVAMPITSSKQETSRFFSFFCQEISFAHSPDREHGCHPWLFHSHFTVFQVFRHHCHNGPIFDFLVLFLLLLSSWVLYL